MKAKMKHDRRRIFYIVLKKWDGEWDRGMRHDNFQGIPASHSLISQNHSKHSLSMLGN